MKRAIAALIILSGMGIPFAGDNASAAVPSAAGDLARMQGTWKVVRVVCPAVFGEGRKGVIQEYRFQRDLCAITVNGKLTSVELVRIGADCFGKTITLVDPASSQPVPLHGRYTLDGDNLVLAFTFGEPGTRPMRIDPNDRRAAIVYLKRVR